MMCSVCLCPLPACACARVRVCVCVCAQVIEQLKKFPKKITVCYDTHTHTHTLTKQHMGQRLPIPPRSALHTLSPPLWKALLLLAYRCVCVCVCVSQDDSKILKEVNDLEGVGKGSMTVVCMTHTHTHDTHTVPIIE